MSSESGAQICWLPEDGGFPWQFPKDMRSPGPTGRNDPDGPASMVTESAGCGALLQRVGLTLHGPKW